MPPRQNKGPRKTLYHSKAAQLGPVKVTVKSDILKSTYKDKPDYVTLAIENGPDELPEHYYNLDSEACATFFDNQKGNTFVVEFVGGKGAEDCVYVGDDFPEGSAPQQVPPPQRPASQPRSAPAPAPARTPPPTRKAPPAGHAPSTAGNGSRPPAHAKPTPEQAVLWAKCHSAQTATLQKISTAAVAVWADEWVAKYGKEMPADFFQAQVASNFIKVSRDIPLDVFRALPVDLNFGTLGKKPNGGTAPKPGHQPPPAAAPEPEPEPEAPPADDSDVPF